MSFNQNRFKGTKKGKKNIGTTVSRFLSELSFRKKNRSGEKKSSVQNIRSLFRGGMFKKNRSIHEKRKKEIIEKRENQENEENRKKMIKCRK